MKTTENILNEFIDALAEKIAYKILEIMEEDKTEESKEPNTSEKAPNINSNEVLQEKALIPQDNANTPEYAEFRKTAIQLIREKGYTNETVKLFIKMIYKSSDFPEDLEVKMSLIPIAKYNQFLELLKFTRKGE